jgi:hypothetical protein
MGMQCANSVSGSSRLGDVALQQQQYPRVLGTRHGFGFGSAVGTPRLRSIFDLCAMQVSLDQATNGRRELPIPLVYRYVGCRRKQTRLCTVRQFRVWQILLQNSYNAVRSISRK